MTRILADLPDDEIERLDHMARKQGKSRAAILRDAIKLYLVQHDNSKDWIKRGAGYWKDRDDIGDAVEYQQKLREDRRPYDDI